MAIVVMADTVSMVVIMASMGDTGSAIAVGLIAMAGAIGITAGAMVMAMVAIGPAASTVLSASAIDTRSID